MRSGFAPAEDGGMVMSILRALQANGPMHRDSLRRLQFEATMLARGSVIATLIRLEREGLIRAAAEHEGTAVRRLIRLTPAGLRHLSREIVERRRSIPSPLL